MTPKEKYQEEKDNLKNSRISRILESAFELFAEKGIDNVTMTDIAAKAEIGVAPNNDGTCIRLNFPPLTEERRRETAKEVKKFGEDTKIAIRNVRRDSTDAVKKLEKSQNLPEDTIKDGTDKVQKATDRFIKIVDDTVSTKEKEVMEI